MEIFTNQPFSMFLASPLIFNMETFELVRLETFFCPKNEFTENYNFDLLCIDDSEGKIILIKNFKLLLKFIYLYLFIDITIS